MSALTMQPSNPESVPIEVCGVRRRGAGAHHIEFCCALDLGGLTPGPGLLHETLRVIAGGGVRADNAPDLVAATGVRELHLSAAISRDGPMEFRNPGVRLGSGAPDEYSRRVTDPTRIGAPLAAVRSHR